MDLQSSDPNTAEIRSGIKPQHEKINETLFRKVGDNYIPAMVIDNLSGDFIFFDKSGQGKAAHLDGDKKQFSISSLALPNNKILSANDKGITVNNSNIVGPRPGVHRVTGGVQIDGENGSAIVKDGAKGDRGPKGDDVKQSIIERYEQRLAALEKGTPQKVSVDVSLSPGHQHTIIDSSQSYYAVISLNGSVQGSWDRIIYDVNRYPDGSIEIDKKKDKGNSEKGSINLQASGNRVYLTHSFAYAGQPIRVYGSIVYLYKD